jgi:hypothetical protein
MKFAVSYHSPEPSARDEVELDPPAAAEANVEGAIADVELQGIEMKLLLASEMQQ